MTEKRKIDFLRLYVQFFESYILYKPCSNINKYNQKRIIQFDAVVLKLCAYIHFSFVGVLNGSRFDYILFA